MCCWSKTSLERKRTIVAWSCVCGGWGNTKVVDVCGVYAVKESSSYTQEKRMVVKRRRRILSEFLRVLKRAKRTKKRKGEKDGCSHLKEIIFLSSLKLSVRKTTFLLLLFTLLLSYFQHDSVRLDFDYFVHLFEEYYLSDDISALGNFINGKLDFDDGESDEEDPGLLDHHDHHKSSTSVHSMDDDLRENPQNKEKKKKNNDEEKCSANVGKKIKTVCCAAS